jgi:ribosomal protein S12 methylthiotransferase accessory factor
MKNKNIQKIVKTADIFQVKLNGGMFFIIVTLLPKIESMPVEIYFDGNKKVNAVIDGFTVKTDQPLQAGGDNSAPTPFSMFLASLGTCAGIYVKGFCDQRGINSTGMRIEMDHVYDPAQKMIGKFIMEIHVPADFPAQYDEAVIKTASLCAVKRHLHPAIVNEIRIIRP